ncbi:putative very-long-chain 3-oxoacyl-CoA reductase [Helianthus annuus]|uniref:Very-long-chain 3-oxoacyl-CoA reductase n=1 Tax=Helianthus annuus TaxID=4232 RepID=A0A9K3NGB9_HELAN|nr:putative very-long-chain 3-oxoacyl-CoA reductase [Helianthus annuus]KAJ0550806.1 putative very-long-chain 3-oxoacyl-CoA reductase [Helianthus annuus]KAJ0563774.1 putative very-long-chain 3-oxoacyl-CoA reductase [Helianthus annuus]KAJ0731850.1 putative very-long-chain 3-oxoacyl-CoA reductase [Helianthus annuus]KAJ0905428.1 putative very-long-chain 3-oxoacyl-CoA reductase [Helianthus annuus]
MDCMYTYHLLNRTYEVQKFCIWFLAGIFQLLTYPIWQTVVQGAATSCYVALHPNLKGVSGKYFMYCNEYATSNLATEPELAKKLWDYSRNLVKSLRHS